MATFDAIFTPSSPEDLTGTVNSMSSSAEIVLGPRRVIMINATQDIMLNFGKAGLAAATASNARIPANIVAEYDTGDYSTSLRIWNNGGSTATWWIQFLNRA